jgi:uncharacterized membrane protein YkoI
LRPSSVKTVRIRRAVVANLWPTLGEGAGLFKIVFSRGSVTLAQNRPVMTRFALLAVLIAAAAATPVVAQAQGGIRGFAGDQDQAREGVRSGRQAPLSRVLQMIGSRFPGRHLNTTLGDAGGKPAYYVQWQMENGRVVVFVVDAETGHIMGRQGG